MKDYYLLLGITRNADADEIKEAYRRSAKKFHPDGVGKAKSAEKFREIAEAYQTLGNLGRRRSYDRELIDSAIEIPVQSGSEQSSAVQDRQCRESARHPFAERQPNRTFEQTGTGENPGGTGLPYLIRLSMAEAERGGSFPCRLLVHQACPRCRSLWPWMVFCPVCEGTGVWRREKELVIQVPPGIVDGTRVSLTLDHVGLRGSRLEVSIQVVTEGVR